MDLSPSPTVTENSDRSPPASATNNDRPSADAEFAPTTPWLLSRFDSPWFATTTDLPGATHAVFYPAALLAGATSADAVALTADNEAQFRNPTAEGVRLAEPEPPPLFAAPPTDIAQVRAANGAMVTLDAAGHRLTNVHVSEPRGLSPWGASPRSLPYGLFAFNVHDVTPGGSATLRMILPDDARPTGYFKQNPATGALEPFNFDGRTGALIKDNIVTLHLVDGGRGDADGVANGVIVDPGGPTTATFVTLVAIDTTVAKFKVDAVTGVSTGAFAVLRVGNLDKALTVNYTVDSSSTSVGGTDYQALSGAVTIAAGDHSAGIIVRPLDNASGDSTKSVRIALAESPDYYIVNSEAVEVSISETTDLHPEQIERTGDRPSVSVATLDPNAAELPAESSTGLSLVLRSALVNDLAPGGGVTYTNPAPVTVNYSVSQTGTANGDYEELPGTAPLAYAVYAEPVWITPIDDAELESPEYVTMTLVPDPTYEIVEPETATVTIHDNERPGTAGDRVWLDQDADGVQDDGEPGMADLTVKLWDADGNLIDTTTTDGEGYFTFTGLDPNLTYQIQVEIPPDYAAAPIFAGPSHLDSNLEDSGYSSFFTVANGQADSTIDAGLVSTTLESVGDWVWRDLNGDGIQNQYQGEPEPGLPGITVKLLRAGVPVAQTVSSADGSYRFDGLEVGVSYAVQFVLPNATYYRFSPQHAMGTTPGDDSDANETTGISQSFVVTRGMHERHIDAGIVSASIGDRVWRDYNPDGLQNDDEQEGVEGAYVDLLNAAGTTILQQTRTDNAGRYRFDGLDPAQQYIVRFTQPDGWQGRWTQKVVNQNNNDTIDSDANPATGRTDPITVQAWQPNLTVDAGLIFATVGDRVWRDLNANDPAGYGVQDGEPGVANVAVLLSDILGNPVQQTTTDADGAYRFRGLNPTGSYAIHFLPPSGWNAEFTRPFVGEDRALDSDALLDGSTLPFTIEAGQFDRSDIDAGLVYGILGSRVWQDTDGDGIQDDSELGIHGVTVQMLDSLGVTVVRSTITGYDGKYLFDGVAANKEYRIRVVPPSGWSYSFSPQGAGSDRRIDSDVDATGTTGQIRVNPDTDNEDIDAGLITAAVGDRVWNDLSADGLQGYGEPGLGGVTVRLLRVGFGEQQAVITNNAGDYRFFGLDPNAQYQIQVDVPRDSSGQALYFFTVFQAGDAQLDSDAGPSGLTNPFQVPAGQFDATIDAGLVDVTTHPAGVITGPAVVPGNSEYTYIFVRNGPVTGLLWNLYVTDPSPPPENVAEIVSISDSGYDPAIGYAYTAVKVRFHNTTPAVIMLEVRDACNCVVASKEIGKRPVKYIFHAVRGWSFFLFRRLHHGERQSSGSGARTAVAAASAAATAEWFDGARLLCRVAAARNSISFLAA